MTLGAWASDVWEVRSRRAATGSVIHFGPAEHLGLGGLGGSGAKHGIASYGLTGYLQALRVK